MCVENIKGMSAFGSHQNVDRYWFFLMRERIGKSFIKSNSSKVKNRR
jgi:hypothetical protein